jgi:Protein of unknown function (DUF3551)
MRLLSVAMLALAALGGVGVSVGHAQVPNFPWCIVYSGDEADGGEHCMFVSYAQCMQTATPGSGASCVRNPRE